MAGVGFSRRAQGQGQSGRSAARRPTPVSGSVRAHVRREGDLAPPSSCCRRRLQDWAHGSRSPTRIERSKARRPHALRGQIPTDPQQSLGGNIESALRPPEATTLTPPGRPQTKRRPLRSRDTALAHAAARWLKAHGATPNGISLAGIVFAAAAGACFAAAFRVAPALTPLLLVAGAALVQGRLACNLLDGMVAVEGGLESPTGDLYNELPDRLADTLIVLGIGYGLTGFPWGRNSGGSAGLLAVSTAYVRPLGGASGLPQCFIGPMAKPHRMAR